MRTHLFTVTVPNPADSPAVATLTLRPASLEATERCVALPPRRLRVLRASIARYPCAHRNVSTLRLPLAPRENVNICVTVVTAEPPHEHPCGVAPLLLVDRRDEYVAGDVTLVCVEGPRATVSAEYVHFMHAADDRDGLHAPVDRPDPGRRKCRRRHSRGARRRRDAAGHGQRVLLERHRTRPQRALIARALATAPSRQPVIVATKGGLTRPGGAWVPDGRARHLAAACEASCLALGVKRLDLYQLHAPDSRTPLATSVRALAALRREGLVDRIGLCNVTVGQIEEARRIVDIDSVQTEVSVWRDDGFLSGVVEHCVANGIRVLAYRPLGGAQRARRLASDALLSEIAGRHGAAAADVALAWLMDLSDLIVPLPGPTRAETARTLGRGLRIALTDRDREQLDGKLPAAGAFRASRRGSPPIPAARAAVGDGELVLIMGLPAAGKSTLARTFVERGYTRINRDEAGGSLRGLLPAIDELAAADRPRIVLDNTYVSRKSRAAVVQAAARAGLRIRCVWLTTSVEDAQVNAASRMLAKYGRLLEPDEIERTMKQDVNAYGPAVQFRYQKELEPPVAEEGFASIETVAFERRQDPASTNRAVMVWCDGVLTRDRTLADVVLEYGPVLRRYAADGWRLLGLGWQPDVNGDLAAAARIDAAYARMSEQLGVALEVQYCPHPAGPPVCWCRKPLPGLGVAFIRKHGLDPSRCLYVGSGTQDPGFARRLGFQYRDAATFLVP